MLNDYIDDIWATQWEYSCPPWPAAKFSLSPLVMKMVNIRPDCLDIDLQYTSFRVLWRPERLGRRSGTGGQVGRLRHGANGPTGHKRHRQLRLICRDWEIRELQLRPINKLLLWQKLGEFAWRPFDCNLSHGLRAASQVQCYSRQTPTSTSTSASASPTSSSNQQDYKDPARCIFTVIIKYWK